MDPVAPRSADITVSRSPTNGFGTTIRNLVINNFADDGIFIDADEVSVLGCFIGTDATGTTAVPNQGYGVQVFGGNGVRIGGAKSGGPCTGDCNLISGATGSKANVLLDLLATGALVRGNFIGTDVTGTAKITPTSIHGGIVDKGGSDRIGGANGTTPGGPCTGDCNLISGNDLDGNVVIDKAAVGSIIRGNYIGTDVTGNTAISMGLNGFNSAGILSNATGAMIGGTTPLARNVVSGNVSAGIQVRGLSTTVQGNYIGTNSAGTAAVPNSGPGVTVSQTNGATIGGTAPGAGNLISGASNNGGHGVQIMKSTSTQIVGNLIGTAADGTTPLPNGSDGVNISEQSSNNTVGGQIATAANTIAFNGLNGVRVDGNVPQVHGNTIRGNSIYSNEFGIALFDNGNDNLAAPTIEGISPLHGTSCAHCTVEVFSDSENEGRVFEGSVVTDTGNWTFNGPVSGPNVTATNTDMSNNTSQFSAPVSLPTPTPTPSNTPTHTHAVQPTPTATRTETPSQMPTLMPTATNSPTVPPTLTPTPSPSATTTPSSTATATTPSTLTPTNTRTATVTATSTPSQTATPTLTGTPASTQPPTFANTPTHSATPTPSQTDTPVPTGTVATTATRTAMTIPTDTGALTPTPNQAATPTETASSTPTIPPTVPITLTPTPTPQPCVGDCNGDGQVTVNELIQMVNIALGTADVSTCLAGDANRDGEITVNEIVAGVNNALNGCGGG